MKRMTSKECGPACEKVETRPGCIRSALTIVGDKWTPFLIARLVGKERTFGELEKLLPGISPRTLSARLKKLDEEDIVKRVRYEEHPPRYRYGLTKKGHELTDILTQMAKWGERHGPCV